LSPSTISSETKASERKKLTKPEEVLKKRNKKEHK